MNDYEEFKIYADIDEEEVMIEYDKTEDENEGDI
jgi:hypothetical protein